MLINKANTPVLSAAPGPKQVGTNDSNTLSNSRKALKPVKLSNDENVNTNGVSMSPRKRILAQAKTNNSEPVAYVKPSLGSRLNKRLSLKKNHQDGGRHHISDKLFKKSTKKDDVVVVGESHNNKHKKAGTNNDVKLVLFQYKRAKITCFENTSQQHKNSNGGDNDNFEFLNFNTSDRILGHGAIEIYSIHDREANYLQCGTVIYPILPKMKILRIGLNQFILPLSNPERYWLISLNTVNDSKLQELVDCFKKICSFRNLYLRLNNESGGENDDDKDEINAVDDPNTNLVEKNDSISSISSDLACLNLSKLDSRQSSLDLELDKFEETLNSFNVPLSSRQPKSCSSSILTDFPMSHNVKHKYSNNTNITDASIHHKPSFDTLLSRNSLYQMEPSWMNIDEGDSVLNKSYDQKTLTDTILFQNLTKFKLESEGLAKLSQIEIRDLVLKQADNKNKNNDENENDRNEIKFYKNDENDNEPSKSMVQRLFGW